MSISVVIPTYTLNDDMEKTAEFCAKTYRDHADEVIISEDGGRYSEVLRNLADVYIYNKKNGGFTKNVNRGWKQATGDFTAIVNSDTWIIEGKLSDLCLEGKVTSPEIVSQNIEYLAGSFFVVPKEIRDRRGILLEEMRTYNSDSEYDHRVRDIFVKVPSVKVFHKISMTVNAAGVNNPDEHHRDQEMYEVLKREGRAK